MQTIDRKKGDEKRRLYWIALLAVGIALYFYFQVLAPLGRFHCNDFRHLYVGAKIIRQGNNPYNAERMKYEAFRMGLSGILPYVYLPFTGIAMSLLTFFSFLTAALLWFGINQLLVLLSLLLMLYNFYGKIRIKELGLWLVYVALFFPLTRNFTAGQLNGVLLFCYALTWHFLKKQKFGFVGAIAAFATLFKLSPGILLLYFFWKRKFKALLWSMGFLVLFMLFSVIITSVDVHREFFPVLKQMSYGKSTWEKEEGHNFYRDPFNQSFNSFFHHAFTRNPYTKPWAPLTKNKADILTFIVSLFLIAAVLFLSAPKRKGEQFAEKTQLRDFALFIMLSLMLPSLCWDHYLVQALFPLIFVGAALTKTKLRISCLFYAFVLYAMAVPFNFTNMKFREGIGIFFMSFKLFALLILFVLMIANEKSLYFKKEGKNEYSRSG